MHVPAVPGRYRVAFFGLALMLAVVVMAPLLPREQRASAEGVTLEGSYLQLKVIDAEKQPLAGVTFLVSFSGGGTLSRTTGSDGLLTLPESGPLPLDSTMTVNFEPDPEGYSLAPGVEFPVTLKGNGEPSAMPTYTVRLQSSSEEPTDPATATTPPTHTPTATSPATSTPTASATATSPAQYTGSVNVTYLYATDGGGAPRLLAGGQFVLKDPSCSTIHYGPVTTDADGVAVFTNVAPGNYCVSMVKPATGFFQSSSQQVSVTASARSAVTVQAMPDPANLPSPTPPIGRTVPATATPTSDLSAPPATATATATVRATATATRATGNENPTVTPTVASRVEPPLTATWAPRQRVPRGTTPAPTSPSAAPSATAAPIGTNAPGGTVTARVRPPRPTADAAPDAPTGTATSSPTEPGPTPSGPTVTATAVGSQPVVIRRPRTRPDGAVTTPVPTAPAPSQAAQPDPTVSPSPTELASSPRVRSPRLSSPAPTVPPPTPSPNPATLKAAVWICEDETRPDTVDFDPVPDIHVPVGDACRPAAGGEVTLRLRTASSGPSAFDQTLAVDAHGQVAFTFPGDTEGRMVELSVTQPPLPTTMLVHLDPGTTKSVRITIYTAPDVAAAAGAFSQDASLGHPSGFSFGPRALLTGTIPVFGATLSGTGRRFRRGLNERGALLPGSGE